MSEHLKKIRQDQINEMQDIFEGKSDKLILVIGPCSADSEKPVLDYNMRLRRLQDEVKDKLIEIGNEMVSGNVNTIPGKDGCNYCKFGAICRRRRASRE